MGISIFFLFSYDRFKNSLSKSEDADNDGENDIEADKDKENSEPAIAEPNGVEPIVE